MRQLATTAAAIDGAAPASKFAIVAPEQFAFGLGRMYQANRQLDPRSTKSVQVFRNLAEALSFLGIESVDELGLGGQSHLDWVIANGSAAR